MSHHSKAGTVAVVKVGVLPDEAPVKSPWLISTNREISIDAAREDGFRDRCVRPDVVVLLASVHPPAVMLWCCWYPHTISQ